MTVSLLATEPRTMTLYQAHTPAQARQLLGDGSDVIVVVPSSTRTTTW